MWSFARKAPTTACHTYRIGLSRALLQRTLVWFPITYRVTYNSEWHQLQGNWHSLLASVDTRHTCDAHTPMEVNRSYNEKFKTKPKLILPRGALNRPKRKALTAIINKREYRSNNFFFPDGKLWSIFSSVQILFLLLECVYLVQLPNFNGIICFSCFFSFLSFIDSGY